MSADLKHLSMPPQKENPNKMCIYNEEHPWPYKLKVNLQS